LVIDMRQFYLYLLATILLFAALACGTFGGSAPEPTATPTVFATPTLAPTATPTEAATDLSGVGPANGAPTLAPTVAPTEVIAPTQGPAGDGDGTTGTVACPAGGQNLLANPGFEGPYAHYGGFQELNHAAPWIPWWKDGGGNQRPEFKPAEIALAPNRVHGGSSAQQYFKSYGQFVAGLYQAGVSVPPGARLQFSVDGQAWSCEEFNQCPDGSSFNGANMFMRVGIDPTGGTDPFGDKIIWSAYFSPLDAWQLACVETTAVGETVTVFVWSSPDGPRQNQDVYWDDASLVILP
jgi:hypothetical protein